MFLLLFFFFFDTTGHWTWFKTVNNSYASSPIRRTIVAKNSVKHCFLYHPMNHRRWNKCQNYFFINRTECWRWEEPSTIFLITVIIIIIMVMSTCPLAASLMSWRYVDGQYRVSLFHGTWVFGCWNHWWLRVFSLAGMVICYVFCFRLFGAGMITYLLSVFNCLKQGWQSGVVCLRLFWTVVVIWSVVCFHQTAWSRDGNPVCCLGARIVTSSVVHFQVLEAGMGNGLLNAFNCLEQK